MGEEMQVFATMLQAQQNDQSPGTLGNVCLGTLHFLTANSAA